MRHLIFFLSSMVLGSACAANNEADRPFYLDLSLGWSKHEIDSGNSRFSEEDLSVAISVGYMLNRYLGFDISHAAYGGNDDYEGWIFDNTVIVDNKFDVKATKLGAKLVYPFKNFSLFARTGLARWSFDAERLNSISDSSPIQFDKKGTDPYYALGVEKDFDRYFGSITFEILKFDVENENLKLDENIESTFVLLGLRF